MGILAANVIGSKAMLLVRSAFARQNHGPNNRDALYNWLSIPVLRKRLAKSNYTSSQLKQSSSQGKLTRHR